MPIQIYESTPAGQSTVVRTVPVCTASRCPVCKAFVSAQRAINTITDYVFCRSCGTTLKIEGVALVAGTRRAETPQEVQGVAFQNDPKGNARVSVLKPNGKMGKLKKQHNCGQIDLFSGVL